MSILLPKELLKEAVDELLDKNKLNIRGLGTIFIRETKPKKTYRFQTKEAIGSKKVYFGSIKLSKIILNELKKEG